MASVLALLHRRTMGDEPLPGVPRWPWQWLSLDTLGAVEDGDVDLVDDAARAAAEIAFSRGIVHGDPSPDNFVADGSAVALLDWASVLEGPLLYDVAVLGLVLERSGGGVDAARHLERCYAASAPVDVAELADLPRLRRLRLAAELVYFTSRLRIPGRDEATMAGDRVGLARTRQALHE
jgi:Ser/Thr protein kinase RdoA (MazF antagonist)